MPDRRKHRGPHPRDRTLFAPSALPALREAVDDLSWLLGRGYAEAASIELVGNRFQLKDRQRTAVRRCACSGEALASRERRRVAVGDCSGRRIAVDGFNLLITVESALAGAVVLVGRDSCQRDLASVWGTYRRIDETEHALRIILETLSRAGIEEVEWYLDRPVSNSGRLKMMIAEMLPVGNRWRIELCDDPDRILASSPLPIVTSDSWVLDSCGAWVELAGEIIRTRAPDAWLVDLGGGEAQSLPE